MLGLRNWFVGVVALAGSFAFAQSSHWQPGRVVAVEEISTPAKTPDPDCRNLPRGQTLPAHCRPANLQPEHYWKVTVDAGNTRYVVRPYRPPKFIETLNQERPFYIEPKLTAGMKIEVAVFPNNSVRLRTDRGEGFSAMIDTQDALGAVETGSEPKSAEPKRPDTRAAAPPAAPVAAVATGSLKIVALENGDFVDLEGQDFKVQDIGDGAALYTFTGESSPVSLSSNQQSFLLTGAAAPAVELSVLQVGKGTRQLLYSAVKKRSASPIPTTVSQVSDTVTRVTVSQSLAAGEYVFLVGTNRAFLFKIR